MKQGLVLSTKLFRISVRYALLSYVLKKKKDLLYGFVCLKSNICSPSFYLDNLLDSYWEKHNIGKIIRKILEGEKNICIKKLQ